MLKKIGWELNYSIDSTLTVWESDLKKNRRFFVVLYMLFCVNLFGNAQQNQQLPDIIFTEITNDFTLLQIKGGGKLIGANMGIFDKGHELLLIDTNLPVPQLLSYVESKIKARFKKEITTVHVTHWHPDHSGGIGIIGKDASVLAHKNVKKTLSKTQFGEGLGKRGQKSEFPARPAEGLPTHILSDRKEITTYSGNIVVKYYPKSHTNGDIVIYMPDNVVYLGDLVWPGDFPFVDILNGGNVIGLLKTLNEIQDASNEKTQFLTGHGDGIFTYQELALYTEMIKKSVNKVKTLREKGATLDQMQKEGLPDFKDWNCKLVNDAVWIKMIYNSIN